MSGKHTPGPWVEELVKEYSNAAVVKSTGWIKDVVEYGGCGTHDALWKNPADKQLALAAPELFEACKMMIALADGLGGEKAPYREIIKKSDAGLKMLEAITKAEGKQ